MEKIIKYPGTDYHYDLLGSLKITKNTNAIVLLQWYLNEIPVKQIEPFPL